jgi:DNA-binding NarL/FixJ family response regulator
LELIKQIKARYPETRMLVISMHDESLFAERALRAGALGYLNKSEAPEQFIKAIHQVLRGEIYLSGGMTSRMLRQIVVGGDCEGSPVENLSDRELEVFELLGGGLTISQIAERLHRSVKTVEAHRERIKRKLELKSSAELTRHAFLWLQENS